MVVATARACCEALAASSAPLAICSIARRNSSAAEAASVIPLASSSLAAATRSSIFCCRPCEFDGVAAFRGGTLAAGAEGNGPAPERGVTRCPVARDDVFMRDLGPTSAKRTGRSATLVTLSVPAWPRGRDRSRSTWDRTPF